MNRRDFDEAKEIDGRISLINDVLKKIYTDEYNEAKWFKFYKVCQDEGLIQQIEQMLIEIKDELEKDFNNIGVTL